jgi:hypothetical protein
MSSLFPLRWYWLADNGQVYSAPLQNTVTISDSGYVAFLAAGNKPTRWPVDSSGNQTNASLLAAIAQYGLAISPAAALAAYAQSKQGAIATGGISVNVGSSGSPQMVEASTDTTSLVLLQGAASIAQGNSSATFQWVQPSGVSVTLTAAQITTIFTAVAAFLQATFTTLAAVLAAITGNTITTTAQIDTPPSPIPAWPVNS